MSEFYKDKESIFIVKNLHISGIKINNISDEDAELIKKINPKMFYIHWIKWTVEKIKALVLLHCTNIKVEFNFEFWKNSYLWFINTPIQLLDSKCEQRITFEWESIKFFIENDKIEKVKLFKTNTNNFLFIPLNTIGSISCSKLREILCADYINKIQ